MKRSFYIIMIAKFGLLNIVIMQVDEVTIYLSQDHMQKITLVYLFILYTQSCNNDQMIFCMYTLL
jgi:hypothetical protein